MQKQPKQSTVRPSKIYRDPLNEAGKNMKNYRAVEKPLIYSTKERPRNSPGKEVKQSRLPEARMVAGAQRLRAAASLLAGSLRAAAR